MPGPIDGNSGIRAIVAGVVRKEPVSHEDVIVQKGGTPIRNTGELSKFLIAHPPGDTMIVVFFRGNKERATQVTFVMQP